jgi:hypothetical protein
MTERLKWNLNLQMVRGPSVALAGDLSVDAYDKVSVDIEHGAPAVSIDVQPGDADEVLFLLIQSDRYGEGLTYRVNGAGDPVVLDQPQFFLGAGAVGVLNAAPQTLEVENNLTVGEAARLEVLVGRKAVPD